MEDWRKTAQDWCGSLVRALGTQLLLSSCSDIQIKTQSFYPVPHKIVAAPPNIVSEFQEGRKGK